MYYSCEICFEAFSEINRIPKVLDCGHTFCSVCLDTLCQSQKICPTCKMPMTKSVEEYPTNYVLFKPSREANKATCVSSHVTCSLKDLFSKFKDHKELTIKNIAVRTALKTTASFSMSKIEQMLDMDKDAFNVEEAEKLVSELKIDLVNLNRAQSCPCKTDYPTPDYPLSNYKNTKYFLFDLANRLHKGEDLYAFEMTEKFTLKLGKMSLNQDRICIPLLSLSVADVDKGDRIPCVSLQELKKCMTVDNFRVFLKFGPGNEELVFFLKNSSFLTTQFIKLCTGETGPGLKGVTNVQMSPYVTDRTTRLPINEFIIIKKYMLKDEETVGCPDYDLSTFSGDNETTVPQGDIVVQMFSNGSCEIRKCVSEEQTYKNVVAVLDEEYSSDFNTIDARVSHTVVDCGISFIL